MLKAVATAVNIYAAIIGIKTYCINVSYSKGKSMEPTLLQNSIVVTVPSRSISKSDIIVFQSPYDRLGRLICKRVTRLEGESAENGVIPANHIWVEGDNKTCSYDSRNYGPISKEFVKSKVVFSWHIEPILKRMRLLS